MSDVYDAVGRSLERFDSARDRVVTSDGNPDDVVRALDLSRASGVPAPAILGDLEEFDLGFKRKLSSEIVQSNPELTKWITSDPLAAQLANDDYGQLDTVSSAIRKMNMPSETPLSITRFIGTEFVTEPALGAMKGFVTGFAEGFGDGPWGSWVLNKWDPAKNVSAVERLGHAGWATVGMVPEGILRGLSALIRGATVGAAKGAEELGVQLGMERSQAQRLGRDIGGVMEMATAAPQHYLPQVSPQTVQRVMQSIDAARPWMERGLEPPVGVDRLIDEVKVKQSEIDLKNLDEALKEASASKTRERSPDMFADYMREHTQARIGVRGEAIAELYGSKVPAPDDGILGWVPNIKEQIEAAVASGGDVQIPLADWLAKVEPEVAKQLHDFTRVRPGGITKAEAKELSPIEQTFAAVAEPVESLRTATALRPLFSQEPRKLELRRLNKLKEEEGSTYRNDQRVEGYEGTNAFDILDERGKSVAELYIAEENHGKRLYVDDIRGSSGYGPRDFGPALMRDLLRQLKQAFPNAEELTGFRVSGARDKAGTYESHGKVSIKLEALAEQDTQAFSNMVESLWMDYGRGMLAKTKPTELLTANEKKIVDAVNAEFDRIIPKDVTVQETTALKSPKGNKTTGVYIQYDDALPIILWALDSPDAIGTARHESLHHLRQYGFFKPEEWNILQKAAIEGDWVKKHDIHRRYPDAKPKLLLEEAIADEFADWKRGITVDSGVHVLFERLKEFLESIKRILREVLGKDPTFEDLFHKADTGEIGSRQSKPLEERAFDPNKEALEQRDKKPFDRVPGLHSAEYMRLIEKRRADDLAAIAKRAEREAKRRASKEWKENERLAREESAEEINARPDIAADNFLREGTIFGKAGDGSHRLAADYLSEEQKAALPKSYVAANGVRPDDVAPIFGYRSGEEMVARLIDLEANRKASGMRAEEYKRRLIAVETERKMAQKYGDKEASALEEAIDQVLSETQFDILHEETLALGIQAGLQFSITKAQLRAATDKMLYKLPIADVSVEKFMDAAGRAGRQVEAGLLKGDTENAVLAFRAKQQQYIALIMAKEARKVDKAKKQFGRIAKRFAEREIKSIDLEFTNYVQKLLWDAGVPLKRLPDEIASSIDQLGTGTLRDFVNTQVGHGWPLDQVISGEILDGLMVGPNRSIADLSAGEYMDYKQAIDSLIHVGRKVKEIEIAGVKHDFEEFKKEVIGNIKSLPKRDLRDGSKIMRALWSYDALMVRMDEVIKDLDLRKQLGPLFNSVIRPLTDAKEVESRMISELTKNLDKFKKEGGKKWRRSLNDTIPQDFLFDPHFDGQLFDLTRANMLNIMLNFGNRSNLEKFTKAYGGLEHGKKVADEEQALALEQKLVDLFNRHASKEDIAWVNNMWGVFEGWKGEAQKMYGRLSAAEPLWVHGTEIPLKNGTMKGGYYPIIYDPVTSSIDLVKTKQIDPNALFPEDYYRATTAQGYTKARTEHVDFIDFFTSTEQVTGRMMQQIHDISHREALMQVAKILYDKDIHRAIKEHYGPEYADKLDPWLKTIANHFNQDEKMVAAANRYLRYGRMNLMYHALGLNLKVIGSPDMGAFNLVAAMRAISNPAAATRLAYEHSKEIPHTARNMDRDFKEHLESIVKKNGYTTLQARAIEWAFWPIVKVSQMFRIITFNDAFQKNLAKGMSEVDAAAEADYKVRSWHGSGTTTDLPAIMRGSESMKIATVFYGFFNTMYNRQRQIPGNLRRGEWGEASANMWGSVLIPAFFTWAIFSKSTEEETWYEGMAKALGSTPIQSWVFLRDLGTMIFEGNRQKTPLGSIFEAIWEGGKEIKRFYEEKELRRPVQRASNVIGLIGGLPGMGQIGRTSQFFYDVSEGKQDPQNILEWARGFIHGESRLKAR